MALPDFPPIPAELAVEEEPLTDEALDAYFGFLDYEPTDADDQPPREGFDARDRVRGWRVEDDGGAEWALRKMAVAQEDVRRLAEQAQDWQARIGAWFAQASAKPQRTAALMEEKLADYALRLRDAGGPATLHLPSGTIKTSERKPAVEVEDDAVLAHWLERRPTEELAEFYRDGLLDEEAWATLVKRTPKVYVGPLRKLVKVEERLTGQERLTIDLACGHEVSEVVAAGAELVGLLGSLTACPACPSDPIEGEAMQTIVAVQKEPLTELLPIGPDGEPVPGASVKPGGIVPKVEAR